MLDRLFDLLLDTGLVEGAHSRQGWDSVVRRKILPLLDHPKLRHHAGILREGFARGDDPLAVFVGVVRGPEQLGQEDVAAAGLLGLVAGGGTTAVITYLAGSAYVLTAATGVGLPLAAVTAGGALVARYLGIKKDQRGEASPAELARATDRLHSNAVERLVDSQFPEGLEASLEKDFTSTYQAASEKLREKLWNDRGTRGDLQEVAETITVAENLLERVGSLRRNLRGEGASGEVESAAASRSPATARAEVLWSQPRAYRADLAGPLRDDLAAVLALEDTGVTVVDRQLTGSELHWLRDALPAQAFLRVLIYDAKRDSAARSEFVSALETIRKRTPQASATSARAVRYAGEDRTPLDRVLLLGSDWGVELSVSLSRIGQCEVLVARLHAAADTEVRGTYLRRFGSFEALAGEEAKDIQVLDL